MNSVELRHGLEDGRLLRQSLRTFKSSVLKRTCYVAAQTVYVSSLVSATSRQLAAKLQATLRAADDLILGDAAAEGQERAGPGSDEAQQPCGQPRARSGLLQHALCGVRTTLMELRIVDSSACFGRITTVLRLRCKQQKTKLGPKVHARTFRTRRRPL